MHAAANAPVTHTPTALTVPPWCACDCRSALRELPGMSQTYLRDVEPLACGDYHAVLGLLEACHRWHDNVAARDAGPGNAVRCCFWACFTLGATHPRPNA